MEYELLFTTDKSLFKIIKKVESEYDRGINLTKILAGKATYFKNNNTKELLKQEEAFGELFIINLNSTKWKLMQETKKIGNYLCYKATTGIKVEGSWGKTVKPITAWYTTEIPVSFGPKNYNGLPGLVLELHEGKLVFIAVKIDLNSKEKFIINKPMKGKNITELEFNNITKKMVKQRRADRRNR